MFIKSSLRPKQQIQLKHYGTPLTDILNVLCVYRSSRALCEQDTQSLDTLEFFLSKKRESLILGDFNAPAIDWQARSCLAIGSFSDHLFEFAEMGHLFQGITFPTRFRAGTSPSVLDLAFFSVSDAFSNVSRLSSLGLSDTLW